MALTGYVGNEKTTWGQFPGAAVANIELRSKESLKLQASRHLNLFPHLFKIEQTRN
jgi:hypothetical protein